MNKFKFTVTVRLKDNPTKPNAPHWDPERTAAGEATASDVACHIREAVRQWGGQMTQDYPLWPENIKVTVRSIK